MIVKAKCKRCGKTQPHLHIHMSQCVCTVCGEVRIVKGSAKGDKNGKRR